MRTVWSAPPVATRSPSLFQATLRTQPSCACRIRTASAHAARPSAAIGSRFVGRSSVSFARWGSSAARTGASGTDHASLGAMARVHAGFAAEPYRSSAADRSTAGSFASTPTVSKEGASGTTPAG